MWALEWQNQVLVIDAGLMFPQEDMLGIDLVLPDISYLLEKGRKVLGIFLSHGHEDHIGGLPFVLKKLNVPVYGTRLTLGLVKPKLKEHRILRESDLREVRVGDSVQLGPFRVETVAVCHSIPDAVALAIQTPVGRVVYTSDFKLDPAPPDGYPTDMERFRRLGDEGVQLGPFRVETVAVCHSIPDAVALAIQTSCAWRCSSIGRSPWLGAACRPTSRRPASSGSSRSLKA